MEAHIVPTGQAISLVTQSPYSTSTTWSSLVVIVHVHVHSSIVAAEQPCT